MTRETQALPYSPPGTPVRLGPLEIEAPVILAPMAGYTQLPFRALCRRYGAALVYTELTNVDGLARDVATTWQLLDTHTAERPVVAHIYGHEPEIFAEAAARIEALGVFSAIDINAGCPVPKIVKRGAGAGLIRDLRRLEAVVRAVRGSVSLPVFVKTRIGARRDEARPEDIVRAVEAGGADAVAIHARFTADRHRGPADWDALTRIKSVASIPVIGNGGVHTAEDVSVMLRTTGVDAVMIGRAALGCPWIFEHARCALAGRPPRTITWDEREAVIHEHLEGLIEQNRRNPPVGRRIRRDTEESGARLFRPQMIHYTAGFRGALDMRRSLNDIHSAADVMEHIVRIRALCESHGNPISES